MVSNAVSYRRCVFALAAAILILCVLTADDGHAAERSAPVPGEYQVKAAFVYNFIKFVAWPPEEPSAGGTIRLCILGELPDAAPFNELNGQEIMGKRLHLVRLSDPREAGVCQVLYLTSSLSRRIPEILDLIRERPVLTVSDTDGYAQRGVMINMYLENKRIRFEINVEAAGAAGLQISSKLLSLAGVVHGNARTEK